MKSFGEKLKEIMEERDISQRQLSTQSGVSQPLISSYCTGKVIPTDITKQKLIKALNVSENYFDEEEELIDFKELIAQKRKSTIQNKTVEPKLKDRYYIEVTKDIKKSFEKEGITDNYLKFNLKDFINTFASLFGDNSYLAEAKKAEMIFNKTSIDYLHAIEATDWDYSEMENAMFREKALLEIRRPTKDVVYYAKLIEPVIEHLKEDKKFIELLTLLQQHLNEGKEDKKVYYNRQTNIPKVGSFKKYDCRVNCFNLYGNKTVKELVKEGGMWAKDEDDAKAKFKKWIDTTFDTVTYKEKDIIIEEADI